MAGNALTAGLSLRIPDVSRATNSASTYRTYQPSEIIGSTTPQGIDPGPPPPPKAECGAAQIIMIVVAIVVTFYTAGATANLLAGVGLQGGVMVGSATVGVNAAGAVIAGAVGGAAGSIASQAVGIAAGAQDSFSWKAVGLAAVGGAVGGAINANAGAFKSFESAAGVARAVTSNVLTQGIGVMTGLQEKFSWQSVAISGAAAAISPSIQKGFSESAFAKDFLGGADSLATKTAANFLTGTTTQIIRMAVYGQGKLDFASLAADAFGNAIGEAVADRMKPKVTPPTSGTFNGLKLKAGSGEQGLKLSAAAADAWSQEVDAGIAANARAWANWDQAMAKQDAAEALRAQASLEARNRKSELYGLELKRQAAQRSSSSSTGLGDQAAAELGNIIDGYGAGDTAAFLTGASAQGGYFAPIPLAPIIGAGGGLNYSYGGKTAVEVGLSIPPGAGVSPVGYGFEVKKKE